MMCKVVFLFTDKLMELAINSSSGSTITSMRYKYRYKHRYSYRNERFKNKPGVFSKRIRCHLLRQRSLIHSHSTKATMVVIRLVLALALALGVFGFVPRQASLLVSFLGMALCEKSQTPFSLLPLSKTPTSPTAQPCL